MTLFKPRLLRILDKNGDFWLGLVHNFIIGFGSSKIGNQDG